MTVHSDSIYKDTQRKIEAVEVDITDTLNFPQEDEIRVTGNTVFIMRDWGIRLAGNIDAQGQNIYDAGYFGFRAHDSAPSHAAGRTVLASPTWDPDGDGNGEIVASDGSAWNEVVDLPNYT